MTDTITLLREQLLQLQQEQAGGALDAASHDARKAVLERQLLDAVMAAAAPPAAPPSAQASDADSAPPAPTPHHAPRASARLWAGVLAGVVVVAGLGYAFTGSPGVIGKTAEQVLAAQGGSSAAGPGAAGGEAATPSREQVEAMVAKLAERMQGRPDDAEGWLMLGRSYMMLGRMPEALTAYERLLQLRPDDANTLVDYADALAVKNGRTLDGEPTRLIEKALQLEPANLKALVLAGTAAYNRNDDAKAVAYWDRAVSVGPAGDEMVDMARGGAAAARERGKLPPAAPAPASAGTPGVASAGKAAAAAAAPVVPAAPAAPAVAAASSVSGTVHLAEALKRQAAPEDTVFIFARPADGSRMPLAIVRKQVKDLPAAFTLDDSASMSPAARLSGAQRVIVGARISKSGQAMPQPGDLQGLSAPVPVGAKDVVVEISSQLP